jgi:hypothetical protein
MSITTLEMWKATRNVTLSVEAWMSELLYGGMRMHGFGDPL